MPSLFEGPTATGREHLKGWSSLDYRQEITVDAEGRDILRESSEVATGDWTGTDTFTHDEYGRVRTAELQRPNQSPILRDYTWTCPW